MREELSEALSRARTSGAPACSVGDRTEFDRAPSCTPSLVPGIGTPDTPESCNDDNRTETIVAPSRKWLPAMAKALWKHKPPRVIHDLIGGDAVAKLRTCYDWCAELGSAEPPGRLVIKLLHSPQGWRVLEWIMRDCKEPWWLELLEQRSVGAAAIAAMAKRD